MDGKRMFSAMISLILEYLYLFIIEYLSSNLLWTNSGSNLRETSNFNTNRRVDEITCRAWGRVPKMIMFYWYLIFWGGLMKIYYAFNCLLGRSYRRVFTVVSEVLEMLWLLLARSVFYDSQSNRTKNLLHQGNCSFYNSLDCKEYNCLL